MHNVHTTQCGLLPTMISFYVSLSVSYAVALILPIVRDGVSWILKADCLKGGHYSITKSGRENRGRFCQL